MWTKVYTNQSQSCWNNPVRAEKCQRHAGAIRGSPEQLQQPDFITETIKAGSAGNALRDGVIRLCLHFTWISKDGIREQSRSAVSELMRLWRGLSSVSYKGDVHRAAACKQDDSNHRAARFKQWEPERELERLVLIILSLTDLSKAFSLLAEEHMWGCAVKTPEIWAFVCRTPSSGFTSELWLDVALVRTGLVALVPRLRAAQRDARPGCALAAPWNPETLLLCWQTLTQRQRRRRDETSQPEEGEPVRSEGGETKRHQEWHKQKNMTRSVHSEICLKG